MPSLAKSDIRVKFFDLLFQDYPGWICLATIDPRAPKSTFIQRFFRWPDDSLKMENWILKVEQTQNVYFCVNMLSRQERKKDACLETDLVWADFDATNPDDVQDIIPPSVLIQSSPGRYQAVWRMSVKETPSTAETYSRRVAYKYGADKSGWDLGQLLRVPLTRNFKYNGNPPVILERALEVTAPAILFEALPEVDTDDAGSYPSFPSNGDLVSAELVIKKYLPYIDKEKLVRTYYTPISDDEDWSKKLWSLLHACFESGMSATEAFSVAEASPCNKYARDGRPRLHLWRDVCKAEAAHSHLVVFEEELKQFTLKMPELVSEPASETFLDTYRDWASEATDAVPEFHDLCCLILLSAIVSNSVWLETSWGKLWPNLWGLVLGDSTLTRKTTAMNMAMNILREMDKGLVVGSEASPEGLLSALAERPDRTSVFYRDEISGFFSSMNRRESYHSSMREILTDLYDVPPLYLRQLRKETITVELPRFVLFGGGVVEGVFSATNEEYITSGFLPRFLVVIGNTDRGRIRRPGPPVESDRYKKSQVMNKVANMYEAYSADVTVRVGGETMSMAPRVQAELTSEAWDLYGDYESDMIDAADSSMMRSLALPTFDRLSKSILKASIIIAASRQEPKNSKIKVIEEDMVNAAWYIQQWGGFSVELLNQAGKHTDEKVLDRILNYILERPQGVPRATITNRFRLMKNQADLYLGTLEDRGLVRAERRGRGTYYFPKD